LALLAENCQLEIIYHQGRVWDDESGINQADLILGDRLIGEAPDAAGAAPNEADADICPPKEAL
jgi:MarR-like DNA-binding transcriptional regulator SgrR of sgrS sRNA